MRLAWISVKILYGKPKKGKIMREFRKWLALILAAAFLAPGISGCKAFHKSNDNEIGNRAQVIRKKDKDPSTMSGFVGGERPTF